MSAGRSPRSLAILMGCLGLIAVLSILWPTYRAFLAIEIDSNEGWNAYYADAAMGRTPLYPARDLLIANNYPPLSFYIVGALGWLLGDVVLAGRLLSVAAVVVMAGSAALAIKQLLGPGFNSCSPLPLSTGGEGGKAGAPRQPPASALHTSWRRCAFILPAMSA